MLLPAMRFLGLSWSWVSLCHHAGRCIRKVRQIREICLRSKHNSQLFPSNLGRTDVFLRFSAIRDFPSVLGQDFRKERFRKPVIHTLAIRKLVLHKLVRDHVDRRLSIKQRLRRTQVPAMLTSACSRIPKLWDCLLPQIPKM